MARRTLVALLMFLAVTAIGGGIALLTGAAPPLTLLNGSPFSSYSVPGLALVVAVGGSALTAGLLLLRRNPLGWRVAAIASAMVIAFEVIEVLVIGSAPGAARSLQVLYICVGFGIAGLSAVNRRMS